MKILKIEKKELGVIKEEAQTNCKVDGITRIIREDDSKGNYSRGLLKKLGKAKKKQEDLDAWKSLTELLAYTGKGRMTDEEIKMVINDFVTLSAYSFNKSHAAAYSYDACETLYMTRYFRPYFWAASLSYDASKLDALKKSIKNAQKQGFKVLPPDVNTSNTHFTPVENGIRFGLNEIKGVGKDPCTAIIQNRPYCSVKDFIIKNLDSKGINKRITTALVGGGAFDNLIPEKQRKKYLNIVEDFYERKKTKKNPEILSELWDEVESFHNLNSETTINEYMEYEKTYLGGNFFHGIFSDIMGEKIEKLHGLGKCLRSFEEVREEDRASAYVPVQISNLRCHEQKNHQMMLFMECEDLNGEKISIPMFGSYYQYLKEKMMTGFYLIKVYNNGSSIIFGSRSWTTSPDTIRAMAIKWNIDKA